MTRRIVVLGAGYAGVPAACRLGNQLRGEEVEVTLVNASSQFVERPRLHHGQRLRTMPLRRFLDPAGVDLVVGTASAIDLDARELAIRGAGGSRVLAYDTLVYALGSTIDTAAVTGVAEHAYSFTGPDAAHRLHARVEQVGHAGGRFVVCGGGLTGIEAAAGDADLGRCRIPTSTPSATPILTGRLAARYKELVLASAGWLFRRPGPYLRRCRHVQPSAGS